MATSFWPAMKACAAGAGSMLTTVTSLTPRACFLRNQARVKYGAVAGAEAATVLPFTSLMLAMLLRTTMPSAPYDLSIWKSCVVATPLAFHTIQVSTVVAAHWMSPDAMARCRLACGIFLMVTSRPFLAKIPASLAKVRGAKPVHPEMPMATLVPCAAAGVTAKDAASATATILIGVMSHSVGKKFACFMPPRRSGRVKYARGIGMRRIHAPRADAIGSSAQQKGPPRLRSGPRTSLRWPALACGELQPI